MNSALYPLNNGAVTFISFEQKEIPAVNDQGIFVVAVVTHANFSSKSKNSSSVTRNTLVRPDKEVKLLHLTSFLGSFL